MASELTLAELPATDLPRETLGARLLTGLASAVDSAVLRAVSLAVDGLLMPAPEDLPALRASALPLLGEDLRREPGRFFRFSEAAFTPLEVSERVRRRMRGGSVVHSLLTGSYRPYLAGAGDSAPRTAPDRILLERWIHAPAGRPRATVLALHGFGMGYPRIDAIALFASEWFRRGLDVALLTLPYHGPRAASDARFSGDRFAVPHMARLAEAVRQASYEIRLARRWLHEETGAPVGLLGLSLGGYLTALAAGLDPDLDFAVAMVPPVCMGDLSWRFFERSRQRRRGADPAFSLPELRAAFRVHSPLAHPPRVPPERLLIVAGRGDRIVPPEHPNALWRHWGEPAIHWFSGSHLAPFGRRRVVRAIAQHLEALGIG